MGLMKHWLDAIDFTTGTNHYATEGMLSIATECVGVNTGNRSLSSRRQAVLYSNRRIAVSVIFLCAR